MDYNKQAEKFLTATKTKLRIRRSPIQSAPTWSDDRDHGIKYICELSNENGKYVFDFWDSIANKESGKRLTAYSVLACLSGYEPEQDYYKFCNEFGYDPSHQAEKIHKAVMNEWNELNKIFTSAQLDKLSEIN